MFGCFFSALKACQKPCSLKRAGLKSCILPLAFVAFIIHHSAFCPEHLAFEHLAFEH